MRLFNHLLSLYRVHKLTTSLPALMRYPKIFSIVLYVAAIPEITPLSPNFPIFRFLKPAFAKRLFVTMFLLAFPTTLLYLTLAIALAAPFIATYPRAASPTDHPKALMPALKLVIVPDTTPSTTSPTPLKNTVDKSPCPSPATNPPNPAPM